MALTVVLFAAARELAEADSIAIELPPGATVAALRAELARRVPALAGLLAKSGTRRESRLRGRRASPSSFR